MIEFITGALSVCFGGIVFQWLLYRNRNNRPPFPVISDFKQPVEKVNEQEKAKKVSAMRRVSL